MTAPHAKPPNRHPAWRVTLLLAALAAAGRLGQLALAPAAADWSAESATGDADGSTNSSTAPGSAGGSADLDASADAEFAALYARCPMSAAVDLRFAGASPEQSIPLLPAHRELASRVNRPAFEPSVPRIRYPVSLRATRIEATPDQPRIARNVAVPPQASEGNGEWLIDPNEWYTPEEQAKRNERQEEPSGDIQSPPTPDPSNIESPALPAVQMLPPPQSDSSQAHGSMGVVSDPEQNAPVGGVSDSHPIFPPPSASQTPAITTPHFAPPPLNQPGLEEPLPLPGSTPLAAGQATTAAEPTDPHLALFAKNAYPSARECAVCHEDIYHEWSASAHAYAAVSPMFHKFEQKLNDLTQGTVGYFCMRCHAPVATALCASRDEPLWNLPEVAREGITCIACHRVQYVYGKSNGERRIDPGDVFAPVFGGIGGEGVAETIHRKAEFKVKTSPHEQGPGQNMHAAGIYFEPLTRSEFCTPCHQVAVHPGIKLEVVWEQYRASPACKKGIQCQDCHMGRVPGLPQGYNIGPVAKISGKAVNAHRKRSNHMFHGPNYSIAHPGVFPFHLKADRWSIEEWLLFDWRAGWGSEEFEARVAEGEIACHFPPVWAEADDRYDAREIIEENLAKLHHKRQLRIQTMENGSHVEGPFFDSPPRRGQEIRFHYIVTNTNEGHNLLTASLGAQPQLWANVVLIGPDGRRLWETGYTDSCGDLANIHSVDVRHKRLPFDWQLFNLQTMFLITGAKGTDREFPVPVNVDIDQLPFIRPGAQPITTINHPPLIRMESQSLAPLGSRRVPYRIPGQLVQQTGRYRLSFRMRSRAEPIYFMRFCNATPEMERSMNEWMIDVHPMSMEFDVP